jgi:2-isopropylmalate synthase
LDGSGRREAPGQGAHSDIIVASAKAYINALNKLQTGLNRTSVHAL